MSAADLPPVVSTFCGGPARLQGAAPQPKLRAMQRTTPSRANAYTGGTLQRATHLREDDAWLQAARRAPTSRFALFRRGKTLIAADGGGLPQARLLPHAGAAGLDAATPWVFIGLAEDVPIFAADVSATAAEDGFVEMRGLASALPATDAAILATARGMLHWRAQNLFCGVCGAPNQPVRGGYVLRCERCGTQHFPRSDPAVIMLVTRGERLLLGQSQKFPVERNLYSTLAGFVEPGENLEDAVRREVMEEVGVRVGAVAYHSSQPWPFPSSLMLGFYAEALSEAIVLQEDEMRDARWLSRDEIRNRDTLGFNLPGPDSIARQLIEDWLAEA